jgi:hypothetical protein
MIVAVVYLLLVGSLVTRSLVTPVQVVTDARATQPDQTNAQLVDKDDVQAANKLFPCPEAKWDVVKQPFWRHRAVLKLRSCQWPHRPTVVIDEEGSAHLITDEIQIITERPTLDQFNAMAKSESVDIRADNAPDYLRFFIDAQLNSRDRLYFGDIALEQKVKKLWQQSDPKRFLEENDHLQGRTCPARYHPRHRGQ